MGITCSVFGASMLPVDTICLFCRLAAKIGDAVMHGLHIARAWAESVKPLRLLATGLRRDFWFGKGGYVPATGAAGQKNDMSPNAPLKPGQRDFNQISLRQTRGGSNLPARRSSVT